MLSARRWYWCHQCNMAIRRPRSASGPVCAHCRDGFVEEVENGNHGAEEEDEDMAQVMQSLARFASRRPFIPVFFGPGGRGPPPASRASVDALEEVKVSGKDAAAQCAVCKDEFELGKYAKRTPCNHIYHADCILPWLAQRNSCPVCRYEMPTDNPEYDRMHSRGRNETSSSGRRSSFSHIWPFRASMTTSQQAQAETSSGPASSGETVSSFFHDTQGNSSWSLDDDGDVIMEDAMGQL